MLQAFYRMDVPMDQRPMVANALLQEGRVAYEGGDLTALQCWVMLDTINCMLVQIEAPLIPLPMLKTLTDASLENTLRTYPWSI